MKKETGYFEEYIAAKQQTIFDIKMNRHFSEQEKNDLIRTYNNDIDTLHRIETAIAMRDLKRTKQEQYFKLKKYESVIALVFVILTFCSCHSTYPVYAKNVFVGNSHGHDSSVVLKSGYYIHKAHYWVVNGKKYAHAKFVKTDNPDYSFSKVKP